jgi:hypothetical protein
MSNVKATIKNIKTGQITFQIYRQLPNHPKIEVGSLMPAKLRDPLSNRQLVIAVEEVQ